MRCRGLLISLRDAKNAPDICGGLCLGGYRSHPGIFTGERYIMFKAGGWTASSAKRS